MESFWRYIVIYLITALPLTAAIFAVFRFILKMREWYAADGIMLIIPAVIYFIMENLRPDRLIGLRALDSINVALLTGVLCAGIFLIRCMSARKRKGDAKKFSYASVIVMAIATVTAFLLSPPFPE